MLGVITWQNTDTIFWRKKVTISDRSPPPQWRIWAFVSCAKLWGRPSDKPWIVAVYQEERCKFWSWCWLWWQCVMVPKMLNHTGTDTFFPVPNIFDTDTSTFFGTKFFRDFFPIPNLTDTGSETFFPVPNFSNTGSDTTRTSSQSSVDAICTQKKGLIIGLLGLLGLLGMQDC